MTTDGRIVREKIIEIQKALDGTSAEDGFEILGNVIHDWSAKMLPVCPQCVTLELFRFVRDIYSGRAPEEPFQEGDQ